MNFHSLVRKIVKDIKPYIPGKPIEELNRELGIDEIYKLASNENPLGASQKALEAIKSALKDIHRYPDGSCYYLKNKLAEFWGLKPQNFIIGNGSDELIFLTLRAFLNPSDEVIVSRPSFLMYELAATIKGANLKVIPMKDFRYDLAGIKKAISSKTKVIFIANPDNPCGTYISKEAVEDFIENLPEHVILFYDEAYYEFVDERDYPDVLKFIERKSIIVTRTFSKIYGLAGIRIGYGMGHPDLIHYLDKVRDPFNVNSLAQVAALKALDDQDFVKEVQNTIKQGREFLFREFNRLGIEYVKSCTNFILVKIGDNAGNLCEELLNQGVIVRYMAGWGLNDYIRVTIGLKHENEKLTSIIENYLKKEAMK